MADEERPHRPNEKYKLSKGDGPLHPDEEKLVFYYNRERRLAKAPPSVRELYAQQKKPRFNLLRPLVADKPRLMSFIAIIVICVAIIIFALLGFFDKSYSMDGNNIEISGTLFEETTIVVLRKTVKKDAAYTGAVDIAVSVPVQPGEEIPLFYHRVFFTLTTEEEYQFVVPFASVELLMVIQTERSSLKLRFRPE
jgi:hypothetical protein